MKRITSLLIAAIMILTPSALCFANETVHTWYFSNSEYSLDFEYSGAIMPGNNTIDCDNEDVVVSFTAPDSGFYAAEGAFWLFDISDTTKDDNPCDYGSVSYSFCEGATDTCKVIFQAEKNEKIFINIVFSGEDKEINIINLGTPEVITPCGKEALVFDDMMEGSFLFDVTFSKGKTYKIEKSVEFVTPPEAGKENTFPVTIFDKEYNYTFTGYYASDVIDTVEAGEPTDVTIHYDCCEWQFCGAVIIFSDGSKTEVASDKAYFVYSGQLIYYDTCFSEEEKAMEIYFLDTAYYIDAKVTKAPFIQNFSNYLEHRLFELRYVFSAVKYWFSGEYEGIDVKFAIEDYLNEKTTFIAFCIFESLNNIKSINDSVKEAVSFG